MANQHSTALPTKDVRFNGSDYDAFIIHPDGREQYLGSRQWSWDAYALCDEWMLKELQQRPLVAVEAI